MIKLIIFDFDGVIISGSNEGYFACYHKALEGIGVRLGSKEEKRRILKWWGKGYKTQLALILKEHPNLLPQAIKIYEYYYYNTPLFSKKIKLVNGARQVLKQLSQKYTSAIASGMMRKTMDKLIKRFNIPFFKKIVTIEDVASEKDKKPAPFMINKLLDFFSVGQKEAVYVGDAKTDVIMAKKAGVTPIVVLTGHLSVKEAEKLGVKYIIKDINYLERTLKVI